MYEQARQNDENNDPGTYHNPTAASTANGPLAGKAPVNERSSVHGPELYQLASRMAPAAAPEVASHASPTKQPKTEEELAHSDPMTSDGLVRSATDVRLPQLSPAIELTTKLAATSAQRGYAAVQDCVLRC